MIGRKLGHYRIEAKLGEGGMGAVYRARDERLERDVALKVLRAGTLADETARKRFRQEALALSQLNHPHICTVYDVGEAEGQAYMAMEYVKGEPLSALVGAAPPSERGRVAPSATARKGVALFSGLACKYRFSQPSETDLLPGAPASM